MKVEVIKSLTDNFESFAKQTETGVEFWLARDLQHLLGYEKWANFQSVISKAKTACENSGYIISDHFAGVGKTIKMPKGATKTVWEFLKVLKRQRSYMSKQQSKVIMRLKMRSKLLLIDKFFSSMMCINIAVTS